MNPKDLTPFGIEVKKRLLDKRISQKEFCQRHKIPEPRFSEIIYGTRKGNRYKDIIAQALGIEISA